MSDSFAFVLNNAEFIVHELHFWKLALIFRDKQYFIFCSQIMSIEQFRGFHKKDEEKKKK